MSDKTLTVRFNIENPVQKRIWEWLCSIERRKRSVVVRQILLDHILDAQGDVTNRMILEEVRGLAGMLEHAVIAVGEHDATNQDDDKFASAHANLRHLAELGKGGI